jgi:hypothetical protein
MPLSRRKRELNVENRSGLGRAAVGLSGVLGAFAMVMRDQRELSKRSLLPTTDKLHPNPTVHFTPGSASKRLNVTDASTSSSEGSCIANSFKNADLAFFQLHLYPFFRDA